MNFIFKPRLHETFQSKSYSFVHLVTYINEFSHSCRVQRKGKNGNIEYGFIAQDFLSELKSLGVITISTFYI